MMVLTHNRSDSADILLVRLYGPTGWHDGSALLTIVFGTREHMCNTFDRSRASLGGKTEDISIAAEV